MRFYDLFPPEFVRVYGAMLAIMFLIIAIGSAVGAMQESEAYNRVTGAQTTAWDAFWLDLRVYGEPQSDERLHQPK